MIAQGKITINALDYLITQLSYLKKDLGLSPKQYLLIQKVKKMTDLVIWGDKNNPAFFESFIQSKAIQIYPEIIVKGENKDLIICSIDCFSKLLININNPKSMNYLLSNEVINKMLTIKFKSLSIEVAEYYINFLKTLSQKLNDNNVSYFLNTKYSNLPLAWQTIRFMNHSENMIRNTARNIILSILRLRDQSAINYLTNFPFIIYYSHFSSFMRSYWDNINLIVETEFDSTNFSKIMEQYEDVYLYFEDMLKISADPIKKCIHNGFLNEGLGHLIANLIGTKKTIGIRSVLFIVGHMISNTQSAFLSDFICIMLFGRYVSNKIIFGCTSTEAICSFRKEWNFRSFWDNYDQKLKEYSLTVLSGKQIPKQSVKQQKAKQVSRFTEHGNNLFGESNAKYESELRKLSNVYGFVYNNIRPSTVFDLFHLTKRQIIQNQLSENTYIDNVIKKNIMKCLTSHDDCLVMLSIKLIMSIILNKHISKEVLLFSGLAISDQTGQKQNKYFIHSVVKSCITVLNNAFDSQSLRINTIKIIVASISKILSPKTILIGLQLTQQLLSLYRLVIQRSNNHLLNSKTNWQKTLQTYESAEAECNKNETFKLVASDLFSADKQTARNTNQQKLMYDFVLFILLRNLRYQLFPSRVKLSSLGLLGRNTLKVRFQLGKQIMISQLENQEKTFCKYKELSQNKYLPCYLILSNQSIFILQQLNNNKIKLVIDSSHKQIMNMIDRSDPRKLILIINEPMKRNLFVMFDDAKACYLTKAKLDSLKTNSMSRYLADVLKHMELCSQDVNFSL